MAFDPIDIKDQSVQYPNRFKVDGVSRTIEPDFGTVTEAGTPVNKALLQRYENELAKSPTYLTEEYRVATGETIAAGDFVKRNKKMRVNTPVVVVTTAQRFPCLIRLTDTKVMSIANENGTHRARVLTVDGTTISVGTAYTLPSSSTSATGPLWGVKISDTKVLIVYGQSSTNYGVAVVATEASGAISFGTPLVVVSTAINNCRIACFDDANYLATFNNSAYPLTLAGDVISAGTPSSQDSSQHSMFLARRGGSGAYLYCGNYGDYEHMIGRVARNAARTTMGVVGPGGNGNRSLLLCELEDGFFYFFTGSSRPSAGIINDAGREGNIGFSMPQVLPITAATTGHDYQAATGIGRKRILMMAASGAATCGAFIMDYDHTGIKEVGYTEVAAYVGTVFAAERINDTKYIVAYRGISNRYTVVILDLEEIRKCEKWESDGVAKTGGAAGSTIEVYI